MDAGYAVVAPDFEGLGAVATVAYPYFDAGSLARSLIFAVRAARHAVPSLSSDYVAVGHSEGGHAVLGIEAYAAETPELTLKGTIAYAPFTSIAASVLSLGDMAAKNPANASDDLAEQDFFVALMAVGLKVESPTFDVGTVMGEDLKNLLPQFTDGCLGR